MLPFANQGQKNSHSSYKISQLKVLNVNCQSIVNKKADFHDLIDKHKLDIIVVGTESWLTPNHLSSEFFQISWLHPF